MYAQIKKEALAVTWAADRLSDYMTGLYFTIRMAHKPLVPLMHSKNLDGLPLRLCRGYTRGFDHDMYLGKNNLIWS